MHDKEEVRQIAHRYSDLVRTQYDPLRVVLFGSYVNGTPREDSDIDIAVVFKDFQGKWYDTWADLVGISDQVDNDIEIHMMDENHDPIGFLEHILETGEIIYERKVATS